MRFERNTKSRTAHAGATAGRTIGLTAGLAVGLAMLASSASAADKYVLEDVEETKVEFGTGWYIRGDIAVATQGVQRESALTTGTVDQIDDISTVLGFQAGMGLRLSPNIRVDATFNYHSRSETAFEGTVPGGCAGQAGTPFVDADDNVVLDPNGNILYSDTGPAVIPCTTRDADMFSTQDLLLNAYYDFSPVGRFTPYAGVGIGMTRMEYSSRQGDIVCSPATSNTRCLNGTYGEETTTTGVIDEGVSYHLASALTLGMSYAVSKNLSVDASYQLTKTFEEPLAGGSSGYDAVGADSFRHAARFGLRYDLW